MSTAFPYSMQPSHALLELKLLNTQVQHVEQNSSPYQKQIVSLQLITILWMCAEAAIALFAALRAHSVALLGFGADSGIELASRLLCCCGSKESRRSAKRGRLESLVSCCSPWPLLSLVARF